MIGTDGPTRDDVERFVRAFYRDAAMDDLLGPIFEAAHVDWPGHIATLTDFWCWQLLGEPGYVGNPLRAHAPVHADHPFRSEHFERWLSLFADAVHEHLGDPAGTVAMARATKMASALERLLAGQHGEATADVAVLRAGR